MHKKRWNGIIPSLTVGKIKNAKDFLAELFLETLIKIDTLKRQIANLLKKEGLRKSMVLRLLKRGK